MGESVSEHIATAEADHAKEKSKAGHSRRVPLANAAERKAIQAEAARGNLYAAWLPLLHAMLEQEAKTDDDIRLAVQTKRDMTVREMISERDIDEAEKLTGLTLPHPNLSMQPLRSAGDAEAYRRKAEENALYFALFSVALGLRGTGLYSGEQLKRIYTNVMLTLSEIEAGCTGYDELGANVLRAAKACGVSIDEDGE